MNLFAIFALVRGGIASLTRRKKMTGTETLEEFYSTWPYLKTSDLAAAAHQYNIFNLDNLRPGESNPITHSKKSYFKICLVAGNSLIHYADKSFEIASYALLFANPLIPYSWEVIEAEQSGYSCIFTSGFFDGFGKLDKYPFFQPGGYPVYGLSETEYFALKAIFEQMEHEQASEFEYKDDVVRNLIYQLIHTALKMRPSPKLVIDKANAARRITQLFLDLLESQFPISNTIEGLSIRSASAFAGQMAVHVNHLNKSVKETMQRTTSEVIAERILKEAKVMLRHSSWAISEIAYSLGFEGPAHFSTFFKKHLNLSPTQFRAGTV